MLIDSHAHLEMREFDHDRDTVIERAETAGVEYIITVGTTLAECAKAVSIARTRSRVYAAVGIHPHEVKSITPSTYDSLRKLARNERVVAYGEIGLDFFRNLSPRDVQIQRFGEQLELAKEVDLPIIIHDREAHKETLEMLSTWKGTRGGVVHCFSGDERMAIKCVDMGFYVSIPGSITYKKSETLYAVVKKVPLANLLIETDAPYLTPHPHRGKRNEPAFIVHTAKKIAEIKEVPFEELASVTSENAKNLFRIR